MEEVISNDLKNENKIIAYNECVIKHTFDCYCFDGLNLDTQYIYIKKPEITKLDMYNELNKKYNEEPVIFPICNHMFCEDFYLCEGSHIQYEPFMGS